MSSHTPLAPPVITQALAAFPEINRCVVGLSGGLDSVVLLHLAHQAGLMDSHQLQAVHINHQLQPAADSWAAHCAALCAQWGIPLQTLEVQVGPGGGPEDSARQARYQAFAELLQSGDGLLLAHHADDQAETVLMRLIRGAGPKGLAGIPASRPLGEGRIVRPLLAFPREQLQSYAQAQFQGQGLDWIEDPSNADPGYDRNFLRHQIIRPLTDRWPQLNHRLGKTAAFCAEADDLLTQLAEIDHQHCRVHSLAGDGLAIGPLQQLSKNRQVNLLRHWLSGFMPSLPEAIYIERMLSEVIPARDDADPAVTFGSAEQTYQVRRHQNALYLINSAHWQQPEPFAWDGQTPVTLPGGTLTVESTDLNSLATALPTNLSVRFRQGGEQIKLGKYGRPKGASSQLKKWLQTTGMPTWQRDCLPLIYVGDELVVVPDFGRGMVVAKSIAPLATQTFFLRWVPSTMPYLSSK